MEIIFQAKNLKEHESIFWKIKKLKNVDLMFCKLQKSQLNIDFSFCKLIKYHKKSIKYFASVKKLKIHE